MEQREGPENEKEIPKWSETEIKRLDRSRPTIKKERYNECYRNTDPWNEMPTRMLGWKSMAQCARVAFGYAGIYDPDEAERIANAIDVTPRAAGKPETRAPGPPSAATRPRNSAHQHGPGHHDRGQAQTGRRRAHSLAREVRDRLPPRP